MTRKPCYYITFKTVFLTLCSITIGMTAVAGTQKHVDDKKDRMVTSYKRVKKVLKRHVSVSDERYILSQRLISLGINDDNRVAIRKALQKEFDIPIPFKYLASRETLGTIVRYTASYKGKKLSEIKEKDSKSNSGKKVNSGLKSSSEEKNK